MIIWVVVLSILKTSSSLGIMIPDMVESMCNHRPGIYIYYIINIYIIYFYTYIYICIIYIYVYLCDIYNIYIYNMCMYDWQVSRDTCQEPEPADADDAHDADAKALSPAICVVHLPRWVLWCGSRTAPCSPREPVHSRNHDATAKS